VRREGVDGALAALSRAGVFVTFREFKGQAPLVRGSQSWPVRDSDFDNPAVNVAYATSTGGSRGRPSRILVDLDYLADTAPHWALWFAAQGWLSRPLVFVTPTYPGIVNRQLKCLRFGKPFVRWLSTGDPGSWPYRLASAYLHGLVRWQAGVPRAEQILLTASERIAEILVQMVDKGCPPCVVTSPSTAARVSLAAQDRGWTLTGVAFLLGGEPLTAARRKTIEAGGASAYSTYGFAEAGSVGAQCPFPAAVDDVHVFGDAFALIAQPPESGNGAPESPLAITTLRPSCPKVMLNAQVGDTGVVEMRPCACLLGQVGYAQRLHAIRSLEKLTGEGVTIRVADLFHLFEETIPARFGGTIGDYQLVEQQDERGLPRYTLLASPALGPLDEVALSAAVLAELARVRPAYAFMASQWAQGGGIHVRRALPIPTDRGKTLPVRTLSLDQSNG
jgi:hypothetical protein